MNNKLLLILIICLLFPLAANAQISVDKAIVNFKAGERPFQNVVVSNSGKEPLFLEGITEEVVNAGFEDEKRVATENLLITPKRFSIEAGSQRTVRLVLKKPPQSEESYYRIKFLPRAQDFEESTSTPKTQTMLKVVFSVGILVLAEPPSIEPKLNQIWTPNSLKLENIGNVSQLLEEIKVCDSVDQNCESVIATRLYPKNTFEIKAPAGKKVFLRKQITGNYEAEVFARP